jgi:hypothetical protein
MIGPISFLKCRTTCEPSKSAKKCWAHKRKTSSHQHVHLCLTPGFSFLVASSIKPQAVRFGICRVVPPEGWANPTQVDFDSKKKFETKLQRMNLMQVQVNNVFPSISTHNSQSSCLWHLRRDAQWVTGSSSMPNNTRRWLTISIVPGTTLVVALRVARFCIPHAPESTLFQDRISP